MKSVQCIPELKKTLQLVFATALVVKKTSSYITQTTEIASCQVLKYGDAVCMCCDSMGG